MAKAQKRILFFITGIGLLAGWGTAGPYPPAAGQSGSTALFVDDPNFRGWATGYLEYHPGDFNSYNQEEPNKWQQPLYGLGKPEGVADVRDYPELAPTNGWRVCSLGAGGWITLSFAAGIGERPGWDFAVFENSLNDNFLELAYVEVSSDGQNFYRFDNVSLTDHLVPWFDPLQIGVNPTDIDGLAGKYRVLFGTPFDLAELRGRFPQLDVNNVKFVRIVDIVGDGTCHDTQGRPIYDPEPTLGSAGFDLDGVGVLHFRTADFNLDGKVDLGDLLIFQQAWLAVSGGPAWNPLCDIDGHYDGRIDSADWAVFTRQWQ